MTTDKYVGCCMDCGKKRYNLRNKFYGITVEKGTCPFCKKKKWIIPASDWAYAEGNELMWD
jgi:hypothetical protein